MNITKRNRFIDIENKRNYQWQDRSNIKVGEWKVQTIKFDYKDVIYNTRNMVNNNLITLYGDRMVTRLTMVIIS